MNTTFSHNQNSFLLNEKPFLIAAGEMHYFRIPREYWQHRLRCARAMGLNTICTYMPWNLHEPTPGNFDFSGDLDLQAYLRLAQDEGLWVILRPGPYICAEWDFGGLPPWLLAIPGIKLRCAEPNYLERVELYMKRVGEECAGFEVQKGGPIILTQVENEYGAFGNDRVYMDWMVGKVREAGFAGSLYTCDWANPSNLKAGEVTGAVTVANFGSRADEQIGRLRSLRPGQPSMCGEFWCGWFDAWGSKRNGGPESETACAEIQWMLENETSFNFYMFHGGTSFGMMAGANCYESYAPTVTSYDYWAPLDEAGRPTPKFFALRELIGRYPHVAEKIPEMPEPPFPLIAIENIPLTESARLWDNLSDPIPLAQPTSMEMLGQNYGAILYRTNIAGLGGQELRVVEPHDYAKVYLNGDLLATLDRRLHQSNVQLEHVPETEALLDILVDTTGRVNFGHKLADRKGITERVEYGGLTLMNWKAYCLPFDQAQLQSLVWKKEDSSGPAFHRGFFDLEEIGDSYLDMSAWNRGLVWINQHCLGRFWRIGPQQTLYLPGAWLRKKNNEIVVFDLEASERRSLRACSKPVLDCCPEMPKS